MATTTPQTAQQLVETLIAAGLQKEEIAFRVRVCLNSVIYWAQGRAAHRGHIESLRLLVEEVAKEPPRSSAQTPHVKRRRGVDRSPRKKSRKRLAA